MPYCAAGDGGFSGDTVGCVSKASSVSNRLGRSKGGGHEDLHRVKL